MARILITVGDPARQANPDAAQRRIDLYVAAIARHGGEVVVLSPAASPADRDAAFATAGGLLLSGGTDIAPSRYGQPGLGSRDTDPERDDLEAAAWATADARGWPVLGICRGFQAINVFSGGSLIQDVKGHQGPALGVGPALTHPLRLQPGSRLARILFPTNVRGGVVEVNSYHHQGVRPADLAPGLVVAGTSSSPAGEIVEALETRSGRFIVGVQCHPERQESTPAAFERLFRVFVDAARGAAADR